MTRHSLIFYLAMLPLSVPLFGAPALLKFLVPRILCVCYLSKCTVALPDSERSPPPTPVRLSLEMAEIPYDSLGFRILPALV